MGRLGTNQLGTHQLGGEGFVPPDKQVWRVIRNGDELESDLYDVEITDTANPFGNFAIAYLDDTSGEKFDHYTRGTKVDFEVSTDGGVNYTRRFSGYVVEAREQDQQGADSLEVEVYSFDQFLRRDTVSNDQSGKKISGILEDIIKTDTPVKWDAANVTVEDDQNIDRSYQGERVENVLKSLASRSSNEAFGVNDELEFFFEPLANQKSPRDIDNTQWFDYDIPEEGKDTVNQVEVFYNDGNESVVVDDAPDKKQLQESLGTQDPATIGKEVSRPNISGLDAAQAVGEKILSGRSATLTGTVTTFGLVDAKPGDVIDITINERGIDGEFRIAELHYRWGRGVTEITIVEKRGDQDEVLVRLSDTLQRIETQDVDRDGGTTRVVSSNVGVILPVSGGVDTTDFEAVRVTNTLRNKLRAYWTDTDTFTVAEIAVGNGTTSPSKTDTSLENELARASVSQSLPDAQSVLFEASINESDIREVGLFDASNNLLVRAAVPDTTFTAPVDIDLRIDVEDDPEITLGVVTETGQTLVRDVIADNLPNKPVDYAYGSDGTEPTESDTALGNQVTTAPLDERNIQSVATDSEWTNITSLSASDPLFISGDKLQHGQSNYLFEAENMNNSNVTSRSDFSGGSGHSAQGTASGDIDANFTTDYVIPDNSVTAGFRYYQTGSGSPGFDVKIDGTTISGALKGALISGQLDYLTFNGLGSDLSAGSHNVELDITTAGDNPLLVDFVFVRDNRETYTDDNSVDANNALSGPELYPSLTEATFSQATSQQAFDQARADQNWNNTDNDQFIALSNDGGSTFTQVDNTQSATVTFAQEDTQATAKVGLSRFDDDTTTTPTTGDGGQTIDKHELFADINAISATDTGLADVAGLVKSGTITGTTLREVGQRDGNGDLLTRVTFAEFDVESNTSVKSSEQISWDNA